MNAQLTEADAEAMLATLNVLNEVAREVEEAWRILMAVTEVTEQREPGYLRVPASAFKRVGDTMTRYGDQAKRDIATIMAEWERRQ